ncbi:MAG TPA: dienelactone hydrolase family protein [Caulobacteraceae bacterium]|jgi:carboxymethylenebutenolidase|nr:dienelactone hydrolase family protein [Caulobacteraceae bacterium]
MDEQRPVANDDLDLSRRRFAALSVAAGVMGPTAAAAAQTAEAVETDVSVKTADGSTDAALFHPAGQGPWPGVILFTSAMGLRPVFRDMGRRLAAEGYTVLIPNPFYRSRKAPVFGAFDFGNPADMAKLAEVQKPLTPDAVGRDEAAWVAYLDGHPAVSKTVKMGLVGYCMGGPRVMQTAALAPDRIGAFCAFHGGAGILTDMPDSPHLLAPRIKAKSYFGIAANDAMRQPEQKDRLLAAFAAAGNPTRAEIYPANHGWCVHEGPVYDAVQAERAWNEMLNLFKTTLV